MNSVGEVKKNSLNVLNHRVTKAEDENSELHEEIQKPLNNSKRWKKSTELDVRNENRDKFKRENRII